jgi:DNA-binding transcriptional regulator YhcF (GntR family)
MLNDTDAIPSDALASAPALTRTAAQTLAEQLAARFADRIRDRLLAPGARLPRVRHCAAPHGLNPSTVVAAYDLLLAQGLVLAQRNRGFLCATERRCAKAPPRDLVSPLQRRALSTPPRAWRPL